jgi:AcrR family transcriptional regulator
MSDGQRRAADMAGRGGARDRLVDAAGALIAEGGVAAATSRAITDRAGENLGSITYYFGSKDALVSEALVRQARTLLQPVLDDLAGEGDAGERLARAVARLTAIATQRRDQLAAYVQCLARCAHDEDLAGEVRRLWADVRARLAAQIAGQKADGGLPGWVDPEAAAALIVSLATGVAAGTAVDPAGTDPAAIGVQFAHLLLAARGVPAPPPGPTASSAGAGATAPAPAGSAAPARPPAPG